ncbi:Mu-like prophage major head subunit gpT family protein [Nocardia sp. NPDC050697]|uniref:Mu-like prophage major head subunit gpT family protein n=1 Tax=Nocardia sp. NPDC050697 TaxID=3155158 RepID=UPI0033DBBA5B
MTVISNDILQGLDNTINVAWQNRFKDTPTADLWKQIAQPVNSQHASENYAWLGAVPGLREFKSERVPGTLSGYSYSITNKKYESTLDVDRDIIEDDNTGQIMQAVNTLATKAAKAYTKGVTAAFLAGFSTAIFDGSNFFDAGHSLGSNYEGTSKDITGANVDAMELKLAGQKDDRGDYLGYSGTHLIVGPALKAAALNFVNARTIVSGGAAVDNPYYKRYEVVVLPDLGITDKHWALADLNEGLLPFVVQIRTAITLVSKTDLNSDRAFDKDIFTWGTRARHAFGYGNHQLIVGAVAS